MHNLGKIVGKAASAGLCLLAAACGILEKDQRYACPAVFILQDAQNLTRFKPGPGRDITDIRFEAEIFDFRGQCNFDEDDGIWASRLSFWSRYPSKRARPTGSGRSSWNISSYCPL